MPSQNDEFTLRIARALLDSPSRYELSESQCATIARMLEGARNGQGAKDLQGLAGILSPEQRAAAFDLSLELERRPPDALDAPPATPSAVDDAMVNKIAIDAASRLMEWSKLFLFWAGIPTAILFALLALLGYSKFSDFSGQIDAQIADFNKRTASLTGSLTGTEKEASLLKRRADDAQQTIAKFDSLNRQFDQVNAQVQAVAAQQQTDHARISFLLNGTKVSGLQSGALCYTVHRMDITADGSPRAYAPGNRGIADLSLPTDTPNGRWQYMIVTDPRTKRTPYIQPAGPTAGYYVSETSLIDKRKPLTDPARYVDAETVPYIVLPSHANLPGGVGVGDLVMVRNPGNGRESAAIIADVGPAREQPGEVSLALARALGIPNPSARTGPGSTIGSVQYILFPKSRAPTPWPRSVADIAGAASKLLTDSGGWKACGN